MQEIGYNSVNSAKSFITATDVLANETPTFAPQLLCFHMMYHLLPGAPRATLLLRPDHEKEGAPAPGPVGSTFCPLTVRKDPTTPGKCAVSMALKNAPPTRAPRPTGRQ